MQSLIVNSAHTQSTYTCLAFSQDGSRIFTGGEEGYVRIWKAELGSMQEPDVATEGEDGITSIATSKTGWLSGSLDSCVRSYGDHGSTMEGLVTRAIAVPIRCIAIDPKGQKVAVTSDELDVRLVDLKDTTRIQKLEGHRKSVRKATWHPSGTILTTSGSDGKIIVWDASHDEPKQLETITGIIPEVDVESPEFAYDCSAVWHPTGKYFVVATGTHELIALSKDDWKKMFSFSDDALTGAITAVALSANGSYVAAAASVGIVIWSTATQKALFRYIPEKFVAVSHLAFSPIQNLLAWTDVEGTLTRWPEPIPPSYPDPVKLTSASSTIGLPSKKKKTDFLDFNEDLNQNQNDGREEEDYGMGDDDWMIDDLGIMDKPETEREKLDRGYAREMVSVTKPQPAFQPGSTPFNNKKRYMAFNMIGVIEVTDQDTHSIINVEFHDRSTHVGSHFQDTHKCHIASLGQRGALYACASEAGYPAQIMYKPYSGWTSSGEWQYSLPEGESVVALAAGGHPPSASLRNQSSQDIEGHGNVVIATDRGYLRFFSGSGIQRYIWTLATDVVSMVAGSEWVFIVHRDGGTSLDGCQNLSYTLIAWDTFTVVQKGLIPLQRGSTLNWIGISEEGAPAMYDSNGLLSILDKFRRPLQARWVPFLDTNTLSRRQGKEESYWPVGVSGTQFMCIILKGRDQHPGFPRPLIQDLDLQMPFFYLNTTQSQIEERFLREELHVGFLRDSLGSELTDSDIARRELALDKELIQLIQLACKADQLQRALDAAALLHHISSFDMAIKVAEFYHLKGVQEMFQTLKSDRENKDRLVEERNQRLGWRKEDLPIPAPLIRGQGSSSKPRFDTFSVSTSIRKSLAPAIPLDGYGSYKENTSWSTSRDVPSTVAAMRAEIPDSSPAIIHSHDEHIFSSENPTDCKRKRDIQTVQNTGQFGEEFPQKKRALLPSVNSLDVDNKPTKPFSNPFARKSQESKMNPLTRATKQSLKKSNSFFEKVDEANERAIKGSFKGKAKENVDSRQTTLTGFAQPKNAKEGLVSSKASQQSRQDEVEPAHSTQVDSFTETQDADLTLENDSMIIWPPSPGRIPVNAGTSEVSVN